MASALAVFTAPVVYYLNLYYCLTLIPKEDEVFYCIEGRGTISVDDEVYQVSANELVFAPVTSRHGIQAADDSRLVVIYFRSPGRNAARTGIVVDTADED